MDIDLLGSSVGFCFVALCVETPGLFLKTCSLVVLVVSVVYLKVIAVQSKKHTAPVRRCYLSGKYPSPNLPAINQPVTSAKVDNLLTEVISLSLRDFVFSWFSSPLVDKTQKVSDIATTLSWQLIFLTQIKLNEMDVITLLSQDIMIKLHSHFKTVREKCPKNVENFEFKDYIDEESCLCTGADCCHGNEERAFLKRAGIVALFTITPRSIWLSPLFTELTGDILSNFVLFPLVRNLADPDYLYQCLLPFIDTIGTPIKNKRFFTQAKTYEDFIKKINKETDLSKLRQLRYKVIAEIMQSMTIENLKQEEDVDGLLSQINSKSYRLSTRNLARYINQCKVAKVTCEKRIYDITKIQKMKPHYADMRFKESETKLLELDEILYRPYVLPFFVQYLEKQKDYGPLKLWLIIEQCKLLECKPDEMYPLIKQGYHDHLTVTSPLKAHQVSRHLIRMAEAYVEHKSGYWQFIYEIQDEIYTMLQEQHYKPFLISSQYMQYVCTTEGRRGKSPQREQPAILPSYDESQDSASSKNFSKMSALKEELKSKEALLASLDVMNYCSDEEVTQLQEEIRILRVTINQLEHHSERANVWWQYLGEWRVTVENVTGISEPLYTILIKRHHAACHQILPFNSKAKFKLTQFSLDSDDVTASDLLCVCGKKKRRKVSPLQGKPRSVSSVTAMSNALDATLNDPLQIETDGSVDNVTSILEDTGDEISCLSVEVELPQSYQSLAPYSMLRRPSVDSMSVDNISSLMFTPIDTDLVSTDSQFKVPDDDFIPPQPNELENSTLYQSPLSTPIDTDLVLSESNSNGLNRRVLTDHSFPQTTEERILSFYQPQTSQSSLSTLPLDDETESQSRLVYSESESTGSDSVSVPSLNSLVPETPRTDSAISVEKLRSVSQMFDSDEETISACSDDLPRDLMFDEIFYQQNSNSVASLDYPPQDSPSTKVRKFLSGYTDAVSLSSNQCDDDKLRALNKCGSPDSLSDSISIEGYSSDSSLEDQDPYLVVDIQSLTSLMPAPQLVEGAKQLSRDNMSRDYKKEVEYECEACQADTQTDQQTEELTDEQSDGQTEVDAEVQTGWIITQTLEQTKHLYLSLRGCKSAGYPPSFPVTLPKDEAQALNSKEHVSDFLNYILRDKTLSQSEQVYRFFNPSCDMLYRSSQSKKSISELTEDKNKDNVAIPFYTLLGEIFEIHGHLQWLRRQIIYLVRITFGSSIERQIFRAINWAGSEQQLIWYTQCFKGSMWGDSSADEVTEEDRLARKKRVRTSLLSTPPHLLVVLFGASKTKKGLTKLLDTLAVPKHGKHLLYTITELVLLHFIETQPEIALAR